MIWTPRAVADLQRLYRFLAVKDPDAAQRAVRTIRQSVKIIGRQPQTGRPAREGRPEFREWPVRFGASGYVVLYHYDGGLAVLLSVRHQLEDGFAQSV